MKVFYSDAYFMDLGQHVFPTEKYALLKDRLLDSGIVSPSDIVEPEPVSDEDMLLVHDSAYVEKLKSDSLNLVERAVMEIPFSRQVFDSFRLSAGGTLGASRVAIEEGIAFNLSGGFHHAFPDHGEGFCVLNDVAIAVARLLRDDAVSRALIVDCDLHQGNGTASIFSGRSDVFTFSIHQENNYPLVKPRSRLDIGLRDGAGGKEYNAALSRSLPRILEEFSPELILYLAGADPFVDDQLGMLMLSKEDLKERDRVVMGLARERCVPLAGVLAGGYASRVQDTVEIHFNTIVVASELFGHS